MEASYKAGDKVVYYDAYRRTCIGKIIEVISRTVNGEIQPRYRISNPTGVVCARHPRDIIRKW